jgi:hypothetical protein
MRQSAVVIFRYGSAFAEESDALRMENRLVMLGTERFGAPSDIGICLAISVRNTFAGDDGNHAEAHRWAVPIVSRVLNCIEDISIMPAAMNSVGARYVYLVETRYNGDIEEPTISCWKHWSYTSLEATMRTKPLLSGHWSDWMASDIAETVFNL